MQEKLGLKISDGRNYFFKPIFPGHTTFVRIGYCSLDENEMAAAIEIWKQALTPFAAK